jgi:hypothetical protein
MIHTQREDPLIDRVLGPCTVVRILRGLLIGGCVGVECERGQSRWGLWNVSSSSANLLFQKADCRSMLMQLDTHRETDNVEKEEGLMAGGCSRVRVVILLGSASMFQMLRTLALDFGGK